VSTRFNSRFNNRLAVLAVTSLAQAELAPCQPGDLAVVKPAPPVIMDLADAKCAKASYRLMNTGQSSKPYLEKSYCKRPADRQQCQGRGVLSGWRLGSSTSSIASAVSWAWPSQWSDDISSTHRQ